jgi:hypothetical protein
VILRDRAQDLAVVGERDVQAFGLGREVAGAVAALAVHEHAVRVVAECLREVGGRGDDGAHARRASRFGLTNGEPEEADLGEHAKLVDRVGDVARNGGELHRRPRGGGSGTSLASA